MTPTKEVSAIIEEYLECIYRLQEKSGTARTGEIAKSLGVVPGTVTNTIKWLKKERLITHNPNRGVTLTKKGWKIALHVVKRHRLSERLLTDILHMEWYKVHDAACKLEHCLTDEIIEYLEKALEYPNTCPHGNPIPTNSGEIIEEPSESLLELDLHTPSIIVKIAEEQTNILHYLHTQGIIPGTTIEVLEKAPNSDPITIRVGSTNRAVSSVTASIIQVKPKNQKR